jgi:hypothetical protein
MVNFLVLTEMFRFDFHLKVLYSPYVNKAFVYIFVSKILSFIRQLFIFSSF